MPFIYHDFSAYLAFCTPSERPPAWCSNFPPSIYTHVQSKYWNVGFLRYWTLQQLPNFIIAAPPLLLLFTFSTYHFAQGFIPRLIVTHGNRKSISCPPQIISRGPFPFLSHTITPHVFHSIILSTAILLASHVQIILRLAASMPLTYWAAAWLLHEYPRCGRWWVGWSVVWGAASVVLWGAFLPPA
jgi:phosphatidylinositol glycan class V